MLFSSTTFLFVFLPLLLVILFPLPRSFQNAGLLAFSLVFYIWGTGRECVWIIGIGLISWLLGLAFSRKRFAASKALFVLSVLVVISPLLLSKYVPAMQTWWTKDVHSTFAVPLGMSFFTFQALSYLIDTRRGTILGEKRGDHYALYLLFFPYKIAGPITRYHEIVDDIKRRARPQLEDVVLGLSRFGWGLAKKQLIADPVGKLVTASWAAGQGLGRIPASQAWIGAIAFTIQIYFDFSAYSDMALGLARIFGFRLPENFAAPYTAISATEFWQRWHMTLSGWFRDYVYIPLGGNRHGRLREYIALFLTFATTALWHGATVPFLMWGGLWTFAVLFERATGLKSYTGLRWWRRAIMVIFIVVSWVPFQSASAGITAKMWLSMVSGPLAMPSPTTLVAVTPITALAFVVGLLYMVRPRTKTPRLFESLTSIAQNRRGYLARMGALGAVVLVLGISFSMWSTSNAFIYFKF